jgi:hypothetical protein
MRWSELHGGSARVRSCDRCGHEVYNLSALSRAEAEALFQAPQGRLCVRFQRDADGQILTLDRSLRAESRRVRRRIVRGAVFALWMLGLGACTTGKVASPPLAEPRQPAQTAPADAPPPEEAAQSDVDRPWNAPTEQKDKSQAQKEERVVEFLGEVPRRD